MKRSKHDRFIDTLCDDLQPDYTEYVKNQEYKHPNFCGEIDLIAYYDGFFSKINNWNKSNYSKKTRLKAQKQLTRAKKYMQYEGIDVKNCYMYFGRQDKLISYYPKGEHKSIYSR